MMTTRRHQEVPTVVEIINKLNYLLAACLTRTIVAMTTIKLNKTPTLRQLMAYVTLDIMLIDGNEHSID